MNSDRVAYSLYNIYIPFDKVNTGQKFVDKHGNLWEKVMEHDGKQLKKANALEAYKQKDEGYFRKRSLVRVLAVRENQNANS